LSAYLPTSAAVVASLAALLVLTLATGLGISLMSHGPMARAAAWALVLASVAVAERVSAREPAGFRMLALIGTLLYAMKAVVSMDGMDPRPPAAVRVAVAGLRRALAGHASGALRASR
jgi:hypothetical protein